MAQQKAAANAMEYKGPGSQPVGASLGYGMASKAQPGFIGAGGAGTQFGASNMGGTQFGASSMGGTQFGASTMGGT